jgi:Holliday junction resolvase RusA-like endonuclease
MSYRAEFVVYQLPKTMGSKRAYVGKSGRAFVVDDNPNELRSFQYELASAYRVDAPAEPLEGAVSVSIGIIMVRPRSHYGSGRNSHIVKASAPAYPRGLDVDKVARSCLDPGTGVLYRDDSQVAMLRVSKTYGVAPEVRITVMEMGG